MRRRWRADFQDQGVRELEKIVHTDHLGTPQLLTDSNQAVVWAADYTPFGSVNLTTQTVTNNLRFPGQYYDQETNLHYNYFRDYDPSKGRYIESDPIGLNGGLNTYLYAGGNSIRFFDADGLLVRFICRRVDMKANIFNVDCKNSQECQCEKEIRNLFEAFPVAPVKYSALFGPNSNSFAADLIRNAPSCVGLPKNAPVDSINGGAPAIDQPNPGNIFPPY